MPIKEYKSYRELYLNQKEYEIDLNGNDFYGYNFRDSFGKIVDELSALILPFKKVMNLKDYLIMYAKISKDDKSGIRIPRFYSCIIADIY